MFVKEDQYQNAYEEYRRRFAIMRNITEEEATEYRVVKEYKLYLEQEYGVTIFEHQEFKDQELKGSRWH